MREDIIEPIVMRQLYAGLSVRLEDDKRINLEANFPSSSEITIRGKKMKVLFYAFKKNSDKKYTDKEGIIFVLNGQTHGVIQKTFFKRKSVGLSYIADSLLVIVDCSNFGNSREREDLFMNSRDRLRDGEIKDEIERELIDQLKNHKGLREIREKRRREELNKQLGDSKPLIDVLQNCIKKSPTLAKLLLNGTAIKNPFNAKTTTKKNEFAGKKHPSFFNLNKNYSESNPKLCEIDRKCRVQFTTDVENEYFNRDEESDKFQIVY